MKHPEFFFGVFLMIGLVRNILIPGFQIRGGHKVRRWAACSVQNA
jgi:hypothetical protein